MTAGRSSGMRTLLLGLDGACLPVLEPLLDDGVVPALASLCRRGYTGGLTSQLPPWTPSAWPSIYTGVNPGKHGVYGFLTFEGYDWTVVDRSDVDEFALWELLDREGGESVVVNVPVTHPPRPIDGAVVPGYVAPEDPTCVPDDALTAADAAEYEIYPPKASEASRDEQVSAFERLARSRGRVFENLVAEHEPDFGFLQFQVTDTVFHERPGDQEAVERVYAAVDDAVGRVLETCDPRNVFVVSDHGIGEYGGYEFRVNDFLRERGDVTATAGGEGMPSWDAIARNQLRNGDEPDERDPTTLERLASAAARVGVTSQRVQRVLEPLGLADAVTALAPTDAIRAGTERVDFPASTAYMRSRIELGVRINLAGREPEGVVDPADYDRVRDELIEALSAVETPQGRPVFQAVRPREDVYEGPYLEAAPDIVVVPAGFEHFLAGSLRGERFDTPREPWNHKRTGVLIAAGEDVTPAAMETADRPHIFDVAPTVLSTLGVPPSERMDGRTLPLVERLDSQTYPEFNARDIRQRDSHTVEQHLANLGYLEDV
ncbi:alkaline phosphatase family protein (plasmid) [Halorientalis pallida]|uniref:alkaline phosphatase family protein n=1 Tax=Halorientalis pallida TaxID=2479928 RepID=UPI003C6F3111